MKNFISFYTILKKEINRIFRIWPQTILPSIMTSFLYFIIFGNIIGNQISNINNYSYVQFLVPGLVMMAIINNSYVNVASSFFGAKFQKYIEEILISPTYNSTIILGFVVAGVFRGLVIGFFVLLISLYFTKLQCAHIILTIIISILIATLFSLTGFLNGIFAKKFDDVNIIPNFIITPMIYLGGFFFPITFLSSFYKKLIYINPIFYMINVFRYGILNISDFNVFFSLFFILIVIVFLYIICLYLLSIGYRLKT
ncbi:MAG: ABC transporter permease [Candidatus Azosocius agrarius]|nr:MAG: ABC transporter permease [Gammaproteobacteria bacterium]